jgi:hypothetical protein
VTGADKRVFPRFVCQLTVELQTRSGRTVTGVSRNLSRGGICLESVDPVGIGEDVAVRVTLVFDEERSSEPLDLPAQVVWCTSFGDAYQVGTQFRPLSQERAQYLDMFLRFLEQQSSSDEVGDSDDDDDPFAA